jgi:hypothetical protein
MSALTLKESKNTPEVILDPSSGKYLIKGKCFPENAKKYFVPILDWFTFAKISDDFRVEVTLDYISSSSVIAVLELFRHIEKCATSAGFNASIIWFYEEGDDDMASVAMNYQKLCKLPIEIKEY